MAECHITQEQHGDGVVVVTLRGECAAPHAPSLERALREARRNARRVILDLGEASAIDSTVLHVLTTAQRDADDAGIQMVAVLREDRALEAETSLDLAAVKNTVQTFPNVERAISG